MSKSGFSTLHRWLGRKNKDKSMANGKLSKSSTNLSISSTNINETSQLEYNRITPLPAATTNAPFEQTFRITVLLPKDQLYVTRLGARVPLSKLLELVCDNKLLDEEKYEFRNPVDPSQVYSCDLTIGAVGLSEIRLCHKSESYDNFNSDEIIKLHRTSLIRESLSSSEFSSRNSKHTTKTASPYSSTNSLNSMDSSAVSCGRSAKPALRTSLPTKMSAPPRKKRAAPRPPSQTAIPEKSALIIENGRPVEEKQKLATFETTLATKDFSISTPNLTSSTMLNSDINGNDCNVTTAEEFNDVSSGNGSLNSHGYAEDTVLYAQVQKKNALNLNSHVKVDKEESCKEVIASLPEPSPRKKVVQVKKKSLAPPAPTPRNSLYQEDSISIASTNVSCHSTPSTPVDLVKPRLDHYDDSELKSQASQKSNNNIPTPVPRITTSTTLLNATDVEQDIKLITNQTEESKTKLNVSKVLLNRTPTPEPRSLSSEPPELEQCYDSQVGQFKQENMDEDCVSKQADSGIGEPVPSPLPDSLPSEVSNLDVKSHFESSSDDDDMVKVYNFKLGKTLVKPVSETKTLEELTLLNNGQEETDSELNTPSVLTQVITPNNLSETSSWNFAIPISPPPNFADSKSTEPPPDTPITPKIMQRPVLNFENLKQEPEKVEANKELEVENSKQNAGSPLDNILQELSSIIQEKGVDSLMKKTEDRHEIEAATPNTLSNFTINTIKAPSANQKLKEISADNSLTAQDTALTVTDYAKASSPLSSPSSTTEDEKLYRKRSSVTSLKQRRSVTRSDSFHSTAAPKDSNSLNKRTSSQLSLDQMAGNLNRRRSSSELSIAESPSLQSLEVIKTILNSRKNSLATNSSGGEEDKEIEVNARRPSEELKFASLELKTSKSLEKSEADENKDETKNIDNQEEKPKELPKVYRYSGPPSINFSTWSERPKSQVAIKNEGDYIFGGAKSNKEVKHYRFSTPAIKNENIPVPNNKPATIQRMGIPEKSYKVPILVKPLQDVIVEKVNTAQKEEHPVEVKTMQINQRPTVESVLRPQTQVIVNNGSNPLPRNMQRAPIETVLRPQNQTIVNTSTLPRVNKQRFSTPVTGTGAQLLRSASTVQQLEGERNEAIVPGPQILRSSGTNIEQENKKPSMPNSPNNNPAPFGQNTLRRTGYKEKIMAKEENEKQNTINVQQTTMTTTPIQEILIASGGQRQRNQTVTSAKLHLNIKTANTSITKITSPIPCSTSSPSMAIVLEAPALKPKPNTPKTAPIVTNHHVFSLSAGNKTPPTAPPMDANIQRKYPTKTGALRMSADPRDDLLAAIRNFKKEELKKA